MNHWRKRLVSSAFTFIGPSMLVTGVFFGLAPSQPEKGSRLKRRFDRFASVEYKGKPYLTPRDFLDDMTFFHPRPRIKRKALSENQILEMLKNTPSIGEKPFNFQEIGSNGVISYMEYIFLLSLMTKLNSSTRNFLFDMMNTSSKDGNLTVEEFKQLCLLTMQSRKKSMADQDDLKSEETSLEKYFFGHNGTESLDYERFTTFVESFQRQVLAFEFNEFGGGQKDVISSKDFALIILKFTDMNQKELEDILDKLTGTEVSLDDFMLFQAFISSLNDFAIYVNFLSMMGLPLDKDHFQQGARICLEAMASTSKGTTLPENVVDVIYQLFSSQSQSAGEEEAVLDFDTFYIVSRNRQLRKYGVWPYPRGHPWTRFKSCFKRTLANPR